MHTLAVKLLTGLQTALPAFRFFNLSATCKYGVIAAAAAFFLTSLPGSVSAGSDVPRYSDPNAAQPITDQDISNLLALVAGDKEGKNLILLRAYRKDGTTQDFYPSFKTNTVKVGKIPSTKVLGPVTIQKVGGGTNFLVARNPFILVDCYTSLDGTHECVTYCYPEDDPGCPEGAQ